MKTSAADKPRYGQLLAGLLVISAMGYGLMRVLVYMLPVSEGSTVSHVLFTLVIIFLGLAIPYAMLKFLAHMAHRYDGNEPEIHLRDIPTPQHEKW